MRLLTLLLLWFHAALSQDHWRLMHRDGSVESTWGTPRLTVEQRAEVVTAWVWTEFRAPRRVSPARIGRERFSDDASRLAVRIVRRTGGKAPEDLRVLAAPLEMWMEISEGSLPSWPVPKGDLLSLPLDSGRPWRLRVAGSQEGSWWVNVRPGQNTVVLTSSPAAGISVTVLDPEGRPVRNLNASLQEPIGRGGMIGSWAVQHGEAGKLAVHGLPDDGDVSLTLMTGGAPPLVLRGRPSALPHQVQLPAGGELVGRLVDAKGAAVAGVPVEAEAWSASDLPQVFAVKGRSGPDGVWHLQGLPAGKVAWSARAQGFVPLTQTVDLQRGEKKDLGDGTLEPGMALVLQVVDDAGDPVPGAKARIDTGGFMAVSDAKGFARFEGLPPAPVSVKGLADGHLGGSVRVDLPFPPEAQLVLPRAFVVMGRLLDASGSPVLRGSARLDAASCQREMTLRDGGRFRFDLPPLARGAELLLRSPTTQELRLRLAPGEAGETRDLGDLAAATGLVVSGRVVRADDGSPVAGARVWTTRQSPDGPAIAWATHDVLDAVTGEDGQFQLSGLLPAPALLRFEAAGLARVQLSVALEQRFEGTELTNIDLGTIALAEGTTLLVQLDGREQDSQGAVARADLGNRWLEPDMLTAQVWNGEARIPNVPPGQVTVSVLSGRRLLCEQSVFVVEGGEQQVDCRRGRFRVSGVVQVGGVPAGDGTLSWSAPDLAMPSRIDTVVSPSGLRQFQIVGAGRPGVSVAIAADGRFETEDLTPGRWRVTWLSQGAASAELVVDLPVADHFETVLPFPGLAVAGTVTDRDGRPAERARVRELGSGAIAFADTDGRFSLAGLRPGKALIQAQLEEQTSPISELELRVDQPPPAPLRLVLGERKAPALTVQVVDSRGEPASGAYVFLEEEGKGQRLLVADGSGKATVILEPPLPPRVRAAAFFAGAWGFGDWQTWKAVEESWVVEVAGAGSLVLRSSERHGTPRILTQGGWDLSWLLRLLGTPPVLSPERPLQVNGLVAGEYRVFLDGANLTVAVSEDHPGEGRIE